MWIHSDFHNSSMWKKKSFSIFGREETKRLSKFTQLQSYNMNSEIITPFHSIIVKVK